MMLSKPVSNVVPAERTLRDDCAREIFAVAQSLRRTGRHRRLRDVTIVVPADHAAVEAIELACEALAGGALSEAATEFERFLDGRTAEPGTAERFLRSVRGVVRRVGPPR